MGSTRPQQPQQALGLGYFILRRTSYSLALARSSSSLSRRAASAPLRALTHMPWQGCSHSTVCPTPLSLLSRRAPPHHTHTHRHPRRRRPDARRHTTLKKITSSIHITAHTHSHTDLAWPSRSTTKPSSFFCPFVFYFQAASAAFAGGASVIRSDETSVFASSFSVT